MILSVILDAIIEKNYVVNNMQNGKVNRVRKCTNSSGGKGINVSRAAAIGGEEVVATGFLGGHTGNYIIDELERWGIKTDFVKVSASSATYLNIYDESCNSFTGFLEPGGFVTEGNQEELLNKYIKLLEKCEVAVISGNAPQGVSSSLYLLMIQLAKEKNKKVILNMKGMLLKDAIKAKPFLINVDREELSNLSGRVLNTTEEALEAAKVIQNSGVEIVVFFNSKADTWAISREGIFKVNVNPDKSTSEKDCEDAMAAGFAIGLARGDSISL